MDCFHFWINVHPNEARNARSLRTNHRRRRRRHTHDGNIESLLIVHGFVVVVFDWAPRFISGTQSNNANMFELDTHEFIILTMRMRWCRRTAEIERKRCGKWWLKRKYGRRDCLHVHRTTNNYRAFNCSFSRFVCIVGAAASIQLYSWSPESWADAHGKSTNAAHRPRTPTNTAAKMSTHSGMGNDIDTNRT